MWYMMCVTLKWLHNSHPSETRFHYNQIERTEHALRNFPVVKVYYEKNDPDASGMAIYDSSVGISLQLGYVDIVRPLQAICNIKQKCGTPPWTEDAFVDEVLEDLTKVGDTKLKKDVVKEEFPTLLRTLSANVEDLEKKKFNSFSISSKLGTYYINVLKQFRKLSIRVQIVRKLRI